MIRMLVNIVLFASMTPGLAKEVTPNWKLEAMLREAGQASHVKVHEIGRSAEGKAIWAAHIVKPDSVRTDACVALFIGQQHADEPAGGEALLSLIEDLAMHPDKLTPNVELWIVPRVNPDGAERPQRRNARGADLNRDHVILEQPETQAIHQLTQKIRPHLFIDCHEFGRDSADYRRQGWIKWPLIMMDTANLSIMPDSLYDLGRKLCEQAAPMMKNAGVNYARYTVGDRPGLDSAGEIRHSTLDADDARNGLSLYGCLSFIIESGVLRDADDPQQDLADRVSAYRELFDFFLQDESRLTKIRAVAEASRLVECPRAIPTNVVWSNLSANMTEVPVIVASSGETLRIPSTTVMHERTVKSAVPMPDGYVISADHASIFEDLLQRHQLAYSRLESPMTFRLEQVRLLKIEDDYDEVYHRYGGRQITKPMPIELVEVPVGSLRISLADLSPSDARRVVSLLEPRQLFGLYQWSQFRGTITDEDILPVARQWN